jgi:hypothetical protein
MSASPGGDGLAGLDEDLLDLARSFGGDRILHLHRLEDDQRAALVDLLAELALDRDDDAGHRGFDDCGATGVGAGDELGEALALVHDVDIDHVAAAGHLVAAFTRVEVEVQAAGVEVQVHHPPLLEHRDVDRLLQLERLVVVRVLAVNLDPEPLGSLFKLDLAGVGVVTTADVHEITHRKVSLVARFRKPDRRGST